MLQQREHNQQAEADMNAAYAAAAAKRRQQTATTSCRRVGYQVFCNTTTFQAAAALQYSPPTGSGC